MEDSDDLDISWFEQHNQMLNNKNREPLKDIQIYFIYLNQKNCIENIFTEKENLQIIHTDKTGIFKERILKIIQTNRELPNIDKKFRFFDLLCYNIDVEFDSISTFSEEQYKKCFKPTTIFNDVVLENSLSAFHSMNAIYILFKEMNKKKTPIVLKPIIKKTRKVVEDDMKHNITKKVAFSKEEHDDEEEDGEEKDSSKTKTRKNYHEPITI